MHHRSVIRQGVVDRLKNKTAVGARVYRSRSTPLAANLLPAIIVYTPDERAEAEGDGAPRFRNELDIVVEIAVAANSNYDDELDALADEIETVLLTDAVWVATFEKILGIQTREIYRDEGDTQIAGSQITITVRFSTEYPPVVADALTTIHADWDVPPHGNVQPPLPAAVTDAEDEVNLPQ